jgi:hypothetical protein
MLTSCSERIIRPTGNRKPPAQDALKRNVTQEPNASQAQMFNELLKIVALAAAYRTC